MQQLELPLDNFDPPWVEAFFQLDPMTLTEDVMKILTLVIDNARKSEETQ